MIFFCRHRIGKEPPYIRRIGQQLCALAVARQVVTFAVRCSEPPCESRRNEQKYTEQPQRHRMHQHKCDSEQHRRHHPDGVIGEIPAVSVALRGGRPLKHSAVRDERSPQCAQSCISCACSLICERTDGIQRPPQLEHYRTAYPTRANGHRTAVQQRRRQSRDPFYQGD